MNKKEQINRLSEITGLNKKESEAVLGAFTQLIYEELKENGECSIAGLGKFEISERSERPGINPATKERIMIPASKSVKFKPCKELKNSINQKAYE